LAQTGHGDAKVLLCAELCDLDEFQQSNHSSVEMRKTRWKRKMHTMAVAA